MRLRVFLVIAVLAGAAHLTLAFALMANWTERTLTREADASARDWTDYALARFDRLQAIAAGAPVTLWDYHLLDELVAYSDVFRIKIYGPDGTLRMVTDEDLSDTLTLFTDRDLADVLAREIAPVTAIREGGGLPFLPETYSETIVPVVEAGALAALVEVYVDQTARRAAVRRDYWSLGAVIGALVFATFAGPAVWIALLLRDHARTRAALRDKDFAAAEARNARDAFLGAIGHDLRSPLEELLGATALLRDGRLDAEDRQLVDLVETCARAQSALVEELLAASEADVGAIRIETAPCALHAFMRRVTEGGATLAVAKGLKFTLCLEAPDVEIDTDARRLRQIVGILLGNAVKFTEEGGITLRVRLDVDAYGVKGRLAISVADTGVGIAERDLVRVFERYARAMSGPGAAPQGAGLGLAVARTLAQAMQGDIAVDSTPGDGSVFTLTLPVAFRARCDVRDAA